MEFPELGKYCNLSECKQLDFLPFTCEFCKKIYCQEHWRPKNHHCEKESTEKKDYHTTICPVCQKIVPIKRGEDPNIRVNKHINDGCPDPGTSTSTTTSKVCQYKNCKVSQLIPIICPKCHKNFCIKHRLDIDHDCQFKNVASPKQNRKSSPPQSQGRYNQPKSSRIHTINDMNEDEQLAMALQQSLDDQQRYNNNRDKKNECVIS